MDSGLGVIYSKQHVTKGKLSPHFRPADRRPTTAAAARTRVWPSAVSRPASRSRVGRSPPRGCLRCTLADECYFDRVARHRLNVSRQLADLLTVSLVGRHDPQRQQVCQRVDGNMDPRNPCVAWPRHGPFGRRPQQMPEKKIAESSQFYPSIGISKHPPFIFENDRALCMLKTSRLS